MSHVTHTNDSCHTHEWVMSRTWMSLVTHISETCHTYECVMWHIWMSRVTHTNESCHTYEWVTSHIRMSHVTHVHIYLRVFMYVQIHVTLGENIQIKSNNKYVYAQILTHSICIHVYMCICIYVYMCTYIYMYVRIYVSMRAWLACLYVHLICRDGGCVTSCQSPHRHSHSEDTGTRQDYSANRAVQKNEGPLWGKNCSEIEK